jgi:high-affinity Fe2+/Pb2+ permease
MNDISMKGVVLGFIVGHVTNFTLGFVLAMVFSLGYLGQTNTVILWSGIIFGALSTAVGGYIAALVAKEAIYLNSVMIGVIVILMGLLFGGEQPLWFSVLAYISILPSALLGGYLAGLRQTSYA